MIWKGLQQQINMQLHNHCTREQQRQHSSDPVNSGTVQGFWSCIFCTLGPGPWTHGFPQWANANKVAWESPTTSTTFVLFLSLIDPGSFIVPTCHVSAPSFSAWGGCDGKGFEPTRAATIYVIILCVCLCICNSISFERVHSVREGVGCCCSCCYCCWICCTQEVANADNCILY